MLPLDVMSGRRKPLRMPLFDMVSTGLLPFNGTYLGMVPLGIVVHGGRHLGVWQPKGLLGGPREGP